MFDMVDVKRYEGEEVFGKRKELEVTEDVLP